MVFIKYPSLTNSDTIDLDHYALVDPRVTWRATEKIHGMNVSIAVEYDGNTRKVSWNSRNRTISGAGSSMVDAHDMRQFQGLIDFTEAHPAFTYMLMGLGWQVAKTTPYTTIAFGELYGAGVQHMDYAENKNGTTSIRFYNVFVEYAGKLVKVDDTLFRTYFKEYGYEYEDFLVPIIAQGTLEELLNMPDADIMKSRLGGDAEGVVYQPITGYEVKPHEFYGIKRKLPAFAERKPVKKPQVRTTAEDLQIAQAVESRITVQRVHNILSHGDIQADRKNMGLLVKAVQADIMSEKEREQPNLDIDKATQYARKHTRSIVKTIKEAL